MCYGPLIAVIPPEQQVDHSTIISVIIAQAVTLLIFAGNAWLARISDRDKRARDTKRDVLLEVAPAIQKVYASLAELTNPMTRIDEWNTRLATTNAAVAKLTAVANDETLLAARNLMTAMALLMVRMLARRVELGTDLEAHRQLITVWRKEMEPIPDLLADFSKKARAEIPLPLDKETFAKGLKASNDQLFAELEQLIASLSKQQSGTSRESQSAQVDKPPVAAQQQATSEITPSAGIQLTSEQAVALNNELIQLRQQAALWEYHFLNKFLVHRTQLVLDWLIDRQGKSLPTSQGYYDAELAARVTSPGERNAILQALEAHQLIEVRQGMLVVTEKGHEYANWRGPTPRPPENI